MDIACSKRSVATCRTKDLCNRTISVMGKGNNDNSSKDSALSTMVVMCFQFSSVIGGDCATCKSRRHLTLTKTRWQCTSLIKLTTSSSSSSSVTVFRFNFLELLELLEWLELFSPDNKEAMVFNPFSNSFMLTFSLFFIRSVLCCLTCLSFLSFFSSPFPTSSISFLFSFSLSSRSS